MRQNNQKNQKKSPKKADTQANRSDFGKGLVICLVKFSEHFMTLHGHMQNYKKAGLPESRALQIWMNGSSDHLYDIEVPEGKEWDEIRKKVKKLQNKGLDMGHGRGLLMQKKYTLEDVYNLVSLTHKIALMVDKNIGLNPDIGNNQ